MIPNFSRYTRVLALRRLTFDFAGQCPQHAGVRYAIRSHLCSSLLSTTGIQCVQGYYIVDCEQAASGIAAGRIWIFTGLNAPAKQVGADSQDYGHLFARVMSLSRQTERQWLLGDTDSYSCATACSHSLENPNNRARAGKPFESRWIKGSERLRDFRDSVIGLSIRTPCFSLYG